MKYSRHLKCCLFAAIIYVLSSIFIAAFSYETIPSALAFSQQEKQTTDSTPYLVVEPNQLNQKNCQTNNNQLWTCVVTLYGQNIVNTIAWNASSSNSSILFTPSKGYLAQIAFIFNVTISNIPCANTSFLFSGQVLGGGGVFPATATWSCIQQPTPTPTPKPTAIATPTPIATAITIPTTVTPIQETATPSPTPITATPTPVVTATSTSKSTTTISSSPTPTVVSGSHSDPPTKGNNASSDMFTIAGLAFDITGAFVAIILFSVVIKRRLSNGS